MTMQQLGLSAGCNMIIRVYMTMICCIYLFKLTPPRGWTGTLKMFGKPGIDVIDRTLGFWGFHIKILPVKFFMVSVNIYVFYVNISIFCEIWDSVPKFRIHGDSKSPWIVTLIWGQETWTLWPAAGIGWWSSPEKKFRSSPAKYLKMSVINLKESPKDLWPKWKAQAYFLDYWIW